MLETDILIIGSGIAGCVAAVLTADAGLNVILVTSSLKTKECNTGKAQGGIIYKGLNDSSQLLIDDILKAGADNGYLPAIKFLAENGAKAIEDVLLKRFNVPFDSNEDTSFDLTSEGAHSVPRIIHSKDSTGKTIHQHLLKVVTNHSNINIYNDTTAIDLLTTNHSTKETHYLYEPNDCFGAYVFNKQTKKVITIKARQTILATGGLGGLFLQNSNSDFARGDGIAMARRVGAKLVNMEYVQFHPTGLFHSTHKRFLISESLRGEGARLINHDGYEFMKDYHNQNNLAPRDITARAIYDQMIKFKTKFVYLDISHRNDKWIADRFPLITETCKTYGYDLLHEPIPVVPVAHYTCGGILVDNYGNTNIKNLKAIGEVSCTGIHGANRLASTSLLECLVWGQSAASHSIKTIDKTVKLPKVLPWKYEHETQDAALIYQDWQTLQNTMWNYVGPIRSFRRLERANNILTNLRWEIENFYNKAELSNEIIALRNGIDAALAVLYAARRNKHSIGCHYYEK